jgi:hypothetical protein
MILMHTEDAAKALPHPECVRMAVAAALETHSLLIQEEVDFTIDVYRTECDKDVTTHRIAALEAQRRQFREALQGLWKRHNDGSDEWLWAEWDTAQDVLAAARSRNE